MAKMDLKEHLELLADVEDAIGTALALIEHELPDATDGRRVQLLTLQRLLQHVEGLAESWQQPAQDIDIDGRYLLFAAGCGWEYREIRRGQIVGATSEAVLPTHVAARDHLAWLGSVDHDACDPVSDDATQAAVLALCEPEAAREDVTVCRVPTPISG